MPPKNLKRKQTQKLTTEEFIEECRDRHGQKYDYRKVVYDGRHRKVIIICRVHGEFEQTPNSHIRGGSGCPKCSHIRVAAFHRKSLENFLLDAAEVHGERYDYGKVVYKNTMTKVTIGCRPHGEFAQTPDAHLGGAGCPTCAGNERRTTEQFIALAKLLHGETYDYSKVLYVNNHTDVIIICRKGHGEFPQTPSAHLDTAAGCPPCGYARTTAYTRKSVEEFIEEAQNVHGMLYDYSKVVYQNNHTNIIIGCSVHADFEQSPGNHLGGAGCPSCSPAGWSRRSIDWLETISRTEGKNLVHKLNGGEHRVGKHHVDGYCAQTNTAYQFHGCLWHGCQRCFPTPAIHPITHKDMLELYTNTLDVDNVIRQHANLVVMWECDYKLLKPKHKIPTQAELEHMVKQRLASPPAIAEIKESK